MSNVIFLERIKHVNGAYLYKDLESPKTYKVTTKALMPDVISMVDGVLEKPSPWKTFGWSWVVTLPLLVIVSHVQYIAFKMMIGIFTAVWFALMVWILVHNLSYSKHWHSCSLEEVSL